MNLILFFMWTLSDYKVFWY